MVINMDETRLRTIEQLEEFLRATPQVAFTAHEPGAAGDEQRYAHISRVLARFDYSHRKKRGRGVVLAYLRHTSGYGRSQVTRLVERWGANRAAQRPLVKLYRAPAAPFARKYTALDVELLVEMDRAHEDVCGPAIAHLLRRAHGVYGDGRYERLAELSVSHLYNLRKRADYQAQRVSFTTTRAVCNAIGQRKAPKPNGRAGYVRIDTVHQGDLDGVKGVYHITCVDEVSQSVSKRAGAGLRAGHQRSIPAARAGPGDGAVSIRDQRVSLGQRLGVHQWAGGQAAGEVAR